MGGVGVAFRTMQPRLLVVWLFLVLRAGCVGALVPTLGEGVSSYSGFSSGLRRGDRGGAPTRQAAEAGLLRGGDDLAELEPVPRGFLRLNLARGAAISRTPGRRLRTFKRDYGVERGPQQR